MLLHVCCYSQGTEHGASAGILVLCLFSWLLSVSSLIKCSLLLFSTTISHLEKDFTRNTQYIMCRALCVYYMSYVRAYQAINLYEGKGTKQDLGPEEELKGWAFAFAWGRSRLDSHHRMVHGALLGVAQPPLPKKNKQKKKKRISMVTH